MREVWLDLARGIAVLSMFVAHVAPGGGVILLTEFFTAPLFALMVVVSLAMTWRHQRLGFARWYAVQVLRAILLMILGVALQLLYDQIIVVLIATGFLAIVAAPLVPVLIARPRLAFAMALVGSVVSPVVMETARGLSVTEPILAGAVDLLAAGRSYRVVTFLVFGLLGLALLGLIERVRTGRAAVGWAAGLTLTSATILGFDQITAAELHPDVGTSREILLNMSLAAAVVMWTVALQKVLGAARTDRILIPLTAIGRLALSTYALQLLVLALLTSVFLSGGRDDHWWVLAVLTLVGAGFAIVWDRSDWPRPLESLIRLPYRLLTPRAPSVVASPAGLVQREVETRH